MATLGKELHEKIRNLRYFLVGAGAIGGAVNFVTQTPTSADPVVASARGGSYGYGRLDVAAAGQRGNVGVFAAAYLAGQRGGLRQPPPRQIRDIGCIAR